MTVNIHEPISSLNTWKGNMHAKEGAVRQSYQLTHPAGQYKRLSYLHFLLVRYEELILNDLYVLGDGMVQGS